MRTRFLVCLMGMMLPGPSCLVLGQEKLKEPTPDQLKAAQDGFAKVGCRYSYVYSPRSRVGIHTFSVPNLAKDDVVQSFPDVPFTFALNLSQSALTADGIKQLKKFPGLRTIIYKSNLVTPSDFEQFARLPQLEELDLTSAIAEGKGFGVITLAELKDIGKLKSLTTLSLLSCKMTPECMLPLKEIPRLKSLTLSTGPAQFFPGNPRGVVEAVKDLPSLTTLSVDQANSDTFRELKQAKQIRTLRINVSGPVAGIGLKELAELDQLTAIELNIYPGTDEDLEALRGIKNLTSLKIRSQESKLTDAGLAHLKTHTSLRTLCIVGNTITNAGVKHVGQVKSLEVVRLSGKLTEDCLTDLKELTALATLDLRINKLTEKGMTDLASMKSLRYLAANIPDSSASLIKKLPNLDATVCFFGLSDRGLNELQDVRSLKYLNVFFCYGKSNVNVTDKGIAAFQSARPDCFISRDRPTELGFEREDD